MSSTSTSSGSVLSNNRWTKYVAASAAGAAATLGAQDTAEAAFTYVPVNVTLQDRTPGNGYFDVFGPYTFGAAGASFRFQQAFNETGPGVGILTIIGTGNISFAGLAAGAYFYPANLAYGAAIAGQNFGVTAGNRGDMAWGAGYTNSQFLNAGTGYIGFRFDVGNGTQYGWIQVTMSGSPGNTAQFVAYGYGMPGEAVFAGQIPEPSSLGMLALGGFGLMAWRRKRARK